MGRAVPGLLSYATMLGPCYKPSVDVAILAFLLRELPGRVRELVLALSREGSAFIHSVLLVLLVLFLIILYTYRGV